jgi:hypothetical protein
MDNFDDLIEAVNVAMEKNDEDSVAQALTSCVYCEGFKDANGEMLNSAFDHLLALLIKSSNYCGEISNHIFYAIIFYPKQLSDNQYSRLCEFLRNNYHLFKSVRGSYLMAEWIGGCRDEKSFAVIKHWFNTMSTDLDKDNVETALWEFLDNDYSYEAPEELKQKAKELQKGR